MHKLGLYYDQWNLRSQYEDKVRQIVITYREARWKMPFYTPA